MLCPTLLQNCVSFMNSRWSPVFWCNNGSTSLSHPPPLPLSPYVASYLCQFYEFLHEVPYFIIAMTQLCSLPSTSTLHCFESVSVWLKSRILMQQWHNFALTPPPPFAYTILILYLCQLYEFLHEVRYLILAMIQLRSLTRLPLFALKGQTMSVLLWV